MNTDVIYGRDFEEESMEIEKIDEPIGEVVIRGKILSVDTREIRNEKTIFIFSVTIEPMVSSLSNLSMVATPLTRTNFPPLISFNSSGTSSFLAKILRTIVQTLQKMVQIMQNQSRSLKSGESSAGNSSRITAKNP